MACNFANLCALLLGAGADRLPTVRWRRAVSSCSLCFSSPRIFSCVEQALVVLW